VVDKVELEGFFFFYLVGFAMSVTFHRFSPYSYIIWEMNNTRDGDLRSVTQSHPNDVSSNKKGTLTLIAMSRFSSVCRTDHVLDGKEKIFLSSIKISLALGST
jgi:hypothetical protein